MPATGRVGCPSTVGPIVPAPRPAATRDQEVTAVAEPRSPLVPRPTTGHRAAGDAERRWFILFGAIALLPVVVGVLEGLDTGWLPVGEEAIIALHAGDVIGGHPPLLGAATSLTTPDGAATYHPGPLLFYVLGPFVELLGPGAGAVVGAAVVSSGSIVALGWVGRRVATARVGAALMVAGSLTLLALGGAGAAVTIHNPQVAVLPLLVFALSAWALSLGEDDVLPLLALSGSFAVQASVVYAPFVVVLGAWSAGAWWLGLRSRRGDRFPAPGVVEGDRRARTGAFATRLPSWPNVVGHVRDMVPRRVVPRISALAIGQVAFVAVLVLSVVSLATGTTEVVARQGSSSVALVATWAARAGAVVTVVVAAAILVAAVVFVAVWLLRRVAGRLAVVPRRSLLLTGLIVLLAWLPPLVEATANEGGNALALARSASAGRDEVFGSSLALRVAARVLDPLPVFVTGLRVSDAAPAADLWPLLLAGAAVVLGWRAARRGDRQATHLLFVAALFVASGALAAARLPVAEGLTLVHLVWVVPAAVMVWLAVGLAVARESTGWHLHGKRAEAWRAGAMRVAAVGALAVSVVASLPAAGVRLGVHDARAHVPVFAWQMDAVRGLEDEVVPSLVSGEGPFLIDYAGPLPFRAVSEGLVAAVESDGVPTVVVESLWVGWRRDFGRQRDRVRWALTVAPEGLPEPPPGEVVARWEPEGWDPAAFAQVAAEVHEIARREGSVSLVGWAGPSLDRTLAGSVPGLCRVYLPERPGCRSAAAYADDPERLLELPPEALLWLYMSGAVASPVLPEELVQRGSAVLAEGIPMALYRSPLRGDGPVTSREGAAAGRTRTP